MKTRKNTKYMKRGLLLAGLTGLLLVTGCGAKTDKASMAADAQTSATAMSREAAMSKEAMSKDGMTKDNMAKDDMTRDSMAKDGMTRDDMAKDDMARDDMTKNTADHTASNSVEKMNDGDMAPDFSLTGIDGQTYRLSDYRGKKVYIKLWASWCSICLSGLPEIDELSREAGDDYTVLTIVAPNHNGEKSTEDFKQWFSKLDYQNIKVLLDEDGSLSDQLGVRAYPSQMFVGSDGVLVKFQPGHLSKDAVLETLQSFK